MKRFKVGDYVTWNSQAKGVNKVKVGQIVAVIPPRTHPKNEYITKVPLWKKSQSMRHYEAVVSRNDTSYLVEVKEDLYSRPKLYWPNTSALTCCNEEHKALKEYLQEKI